MAMHFIALSTIAVTLELHHRHPALLASAVKTSNSPMVRRYFPGYFVRAAQVVFVVLRFFCLMHFVVFRELCRMFCRILGFCVFGLKGLKLLQMAIPHAEIDGFLVSRSSHRAHAARNPTKNYFNCDVFSSRGRNGGST